MELVKALAPPVAALIALVAVIVNLYNTRRQIRANAENLQKQLNASAENLQKQLEASALNLELQLATQGKEADKNRQAQFAYVLRAERRDTLTRAAEVVHRMQDGMSRLWILQGQSMHLSWGDEYDALHADQTATRQELGRSALESQFVATVLEMIELTALASDVREYQRRVLDYADGQIQGENYRDLSHRARTLFDQFSAKLRS